MPGTERPIWQRNYGACPEPAEGNTSSATKAKWTVSPVTSNPIRPVGRRTRRIQAELNRRGEAPPRPYADVSSRRFCRIILLIHFGGKPHARTKTSIESLPFDRLRASLCHALADRDAVRALYNRLVTLALAGNAREDDVDAWFDKA